MKNIQHNFKVKYDLLESQKKLLERKLEEEVRNSIRLSQEVERLQWSKRNLQEYIDKLQKDHIRELRDVIEKRRP